MAARRYECELYKGDDPVEFADALADWLELHGKPMKRAAIETSGLVGVRDTSVMQNRLFSARKLLQAMYGVPDEDIADPGADRTSLKYRAATADMYLRLGTLIVRNTPEAVVDAVRQARTRMACRLAAVLMWSDSLGCTADYLMMPSSWLEPCALDCCDYELLQAAVALQITAFGSGCHDMIRQSKGRVR